MAEQQSPEEILGYFQGQDEIKRALLSKINSAIGTQRVLPHMLFCGPPECGKVFLARVLAEALGVSYQHAKVAYLRELSDILSYLTNASERSILLIEDIESLPKSVAEFLLTVFERRQVDIEMGEGANRRMLSMPLKPFTIIGTTTAPSRVSSKLAPWFTVYDFKPYTFKEYWYVVRSMAHQARLPVDAACIESLVLCCDRPQCVRDDSLMPAAALTQAAVLAKRVRQFLADDEYCKMLLDSNQSVPQEFIEWSLDNLGYRANQQTSISLAEKIRAMKDLEFEQFVAGLFEKQGYHVQFTPATGDHGIDLLMRKDGQKTIVQCKRWEGAVGEPMIRDFYGSMIHSGADRGIIATSAYFTPQAVAFAENKPIALLDLDALLQLAQGHGLPSTETRRLF